MKKDQGLRRKISVNNHRGACVMDNHLTPEQIAEIKRRMSDREPFATDGEVRRTFARLTKARKRS
jgi:hypothetical protein